MAYKFFDKKFLVMPDDKSIIGKKVFYTNSISCLISIVESGDSSGIGVVNGMLADCYTPFFVDGVYWGLIYYDPNYECKVAYSQGKQIQFRSDNTNDWVDAKEPTWSERLEYRIKPEPVFEVIKQDGVYKKVSCSLVPNFFSGTSEECDAWIVEHTPKTRRMTNRELVRWLAEGNGERLDVVAKFVSVHCIYTEGCDDEACDEDIRIREWGSNEWHEPLVEVTE